MPKTTRKTATTEAPFDLEEQIRARAYELYEERGREDGHHEEDWLTAEREIRGVNVDKAAA
jgi:Protein of unknown function (DUF2934)